jgi:hypothetical protein
MRWRGMHQLGAAQDEAAFWRSGGKSVARHMMLAGDRRPMSSHTLLAAAHEAIGFGRGVYLPETELEIWRHRDPLA